MEPSTARILHCLRDTLLTRLAPRMPDRDALYLVGAMDVALTELLHRETDRDALAAQKVKRHADLITKGRAILQRGGDPQERITKSDKTQTSEAALAGLVAQICALPNADAGEWIERMLQAEVQDVLTAQAPIAHVETEAFDPLAFDRTALAAEIGHGLERGGPVQIERIDVLSGGFSRSTLAVAWRDAAGQGDLVLRRQKLDGILASVCLSAVDEFPVLRFAHQHGVRVPEQYWAQPDSSIIGGPFIAMERAPGRPLGSAMGAQGVDDSIMRQIAEELAKLHNLPWRNDEARLASAFGLRAGAIDAERSLDALLQRWKVLWDSAALTPSPAMNAAYAFLQRNRPAQAPGICLLNGDIGFHNLLFDKGRLTAWLDWETAFIGDPAKDIATCRSFVPLYIDWSRFLHWYQDAGGFAPDERSVDYYSVLRVFTQLIVGEMGLQTKFARNERSEIEYLMLGGPVRSYFYNDYKSCIGIIARAMAGEGK